MGKSIGYFQEIDYIEKVINFFTICDRCMANIVNVGSGGIQKVKEQVLSEKTDECSHNTRRRNFSKCLKWKFTPKYF